MKRKNFKKPMISALEQRILFDGAAVATAVDVLDESSFSSNNNTQTTTNSNDVTQNNAENSVHEAQAVQGFERPRREVAFVDVTVSDYQTLVDGVGEGVEVYLVSSLDDINSILKSETNIDAIHILSHGNVGEITVGNDVLNQNTLNSFDAVLQTMKNSLSENGDILLYGCNVASDGTGQEFIDTLASITEADVAASNDVTGNSSVNGNWDLEIQKGSIETSTIVVENYNYSLAPSISGLTNISFTEHDPKITAANSISFSGGANYGNGYIEFKVSSNMDVGDRLSIDSGGSVTVTGNNVYYSGTLVGTIDSTYNGESGKALRINLLNQTIAGTSPVKNGDFSAGMTGWTSVLSHIDLGVTQIAGWNTPSDSLITYPSSTPGNDDNDLVSGFYNPYVGVDSGRLKLEKTNLTTTGFGVAHGPAAYSDIFNATTGMVLKFDWQANNVNDDYHVVGYLLNTSNGAISIALQSYGTTGSGTASVTVPTSENYRFVFVSGTFDATGGTVAGASMYIDNIRVEDPFVTDAVVTEIARQIDYINSTDDLNINKIVTVTAKNSLNETTSSNFNINVTTSNDLPYISGKETVTVNEDTSITISGLTVGDKDIGSGNLTVTIDASHGTLSLGNSTGVTTSWNDVNKTFQITGTVTNLNNALATLRYQGDANWFGDDPLTITINDGQGSGEQPYRINQTGKFFNPDNGHYYEFVSASGITWDQAKTNSESRTLYGLNGYLVTITSDSENTLITSMAGGNGWIGASDAQSEGIWKWVTGPEKGTQFWTGDTNAGTNSTSNYGLSYNGQYSNWANGEPNNSDSSRNGEDVAHFYYSGINTGKWNDFAATNNSAIAGYIVEYGGYGGTLAAANLTVKVLSVNDLPVNNIPTARTTNEDVNIVFSTANGNAISISDNDALNDPSVILTTTLSIGSGKGSLTLTEGSGATITNNGSTTVQITGTVAQINASLEGLTYTPTLNATGTAYTTLTITTNDGIATDTDSITINITPVDDKPVANAMAATVGVGSAQLFSYFQPKFFDVEGDSPVAIKLLSSPDKGQFEYWNGTSWKIVTINETTPLVVAMSDMNNYRFNALSESNTSTTVQWQVKTAGDTSDTGWSNTATGTISILSYADNTTPSVSITYPEGTKTGTSSEEVIESPDSTNPTSSVKTVTSNNVITINEDSQTATITLTYSDSVTPAQFMQGILSSSNTRLIDFADSSTFKMTQSVTNNVGTITLILKPKANMYGETLITLGAFDGQKTTQETFILRVNSVNEQAIVDNFTRTINEDTSFSFATINPADIYHDANDVNNNANVSAVDYNAQMAIIQDAMKHPSNTDKQAAKITAIETLVEANYFPQSFIIDTLPTNGNLYLGTTRITAVGFVIAIADLETLNYVPNANYYGTDSFTWHALDKDDLATTTKTATFSVNSINDAPTISVSTPSGFTESTDINNQTLTQSGTVTFNDIDNNVNITYNYNNDISWSGGTLDSAVSAALISGFSTGATNVSSGTTTWNYNVNNIDLNFLAQGETITLSYMVTVTDLSGVTDTETISFIITGTNDTPNIKVEAGNSESATISETNSTLNANGTLSVKDLDTTDVITTSYEVVSVQKSLNGNVMPTDKNEPINQLLKDMLTITQTPIDGTTQTGIINWTFNSNGETFDYLASGETLTLTYTIKASDDNNPIASDTQTITITIVGTNDTPNISVESGNSDKATINETNSTLNANGTLSVKDLDTTDVITTSYEVVSVQKSLNGNVMPTDKNEPINQLLKDMLTITQTPIDGTTQTGIINWTFNSNGETFDYLASGETLTLTYTIKASDDDISKASDTQIVTITIVGTNDTPNISVESGNSDKATINETNSTLNANGTLSVKDLDTTDVITTSYEVVSVQKSLNGNVMPTDKNEPINQLLKDMLTITQTPIDGTTQTGIINWTFNSNGETFDYLASGETLTLTYTIKASDDNNPIASDTQTITITIVGTNDTPNIKVEAGNSESATISETNSTLNANGTLSVKDLDTTDVITTSYEVVSVQKSLNGNVMPTDKNEPINSLLKDMLTITQTPIDGTTQTGIINWTFDSKGETFDYLASGETLTLTYTIKASDDNNPIASDTQTITITIVGTNDTPNIKVEAGNSESATISETNSTLNANGTLSVKDLDTTDVITTSYEVVSVQKSLNGNVMPTDKNEPINQLLKDMLTITQTPIDGTTQTGIINWTFDSKGETFDYLASGETLTLTYTIKASDDNNPIASDTQTITITIVGTNDTPNIKVEAGNSESATISETNSTLNANGTLSVKDLDTTDVITTSYEVVSVQKSLNGNVMPTDKNEPINQLLKDMLTITQTPIDGTTQTGIINWTFNSNGETFDYLASGETLTLTYTIKASDDNNPIASDTQTITITIVGTNDTPNISVESGNSDKATINETNSTLNANGTLSVKDLDTTDVITTSYEVVSVQKSLNGNVMPTDKNEPINQLLKDMLTITQTPIDGTTQTGIINWTFNSNGETFDYLASGETLTLTYTIKASDDNNPIASDTQTITITIVGTNDTPNISVESGNSDKATINETNSTLNANGTLSVKDLDTTDVITTSYEVVSVQKSLNGNVMPTDKNEPINQLLKDMLTITQTPIDGTTQTGIINWTFNSNGETFDYLASGETLTLTYTIKASDDDISKASDTQIVTITIVGTNDTPNISVESGNSDKATINETNSTLNANGTLSVKDLDTTDVITTSYEVVSVQKSLNGNVMPTDKNEPINQLLKDMLTITQTPIDGTTQTGIINWTFDSKGETFDYLASGETLTLTYTIKASDDNNPIASDTQTITITIVGTNDTPNIKVEAGNSESATISETNSTLNANGTLSVKDLDTTDVITTSYEVVSVQKSLNGNVMPTDKNEPINSLLKDMLSITHTPIDGTTQTGVINWTFDSGNEAFNYLATGETLTLTYTITATDDNGTPASDTQTVVITITGTNDTPNITVDSGNSASSSLIETNTTLTSSGTLNVVDLDRTDVITTSHVVSSVQKDASGNVMNTDSNEPINSLLKDMLSITHTPIDGTTQTGVINWTFDSGNEAFNYLATGETLTLTYTITATDDNGTPASDTQTVVITITGTNDTPTVSLENIDDKTPFGKEFTKETAYLFSDLDTTDVFNFEAVNLPRGLIIDSRTGIISGAPVESGIFEVTLKITDSGTPTLGVTRTFSLLVIAPPQPEVAKTITPPSVVEPLSTNNEIKLSNYSSTNNNLGVLNFNSNDGLSFDTGIGFLDTSNNSSTNGGELNSSNIQNGEIDSSNNNSTNTSNTNDSRGVLQANVDLNVLTNGQIVFNEANQDSFSIVGITIEDIKIENNSIEIKVVDTNLSQNFIVTQIDGSPLPTGLFFDAKTGSVSGTVPEGLDKLNITIKATNSDGTTRVLNLKLDLKELKKSQANQADADEKYMGLKEQIALENQKLDDYGSYLTRLFA